MKNIPILLILTLAPLAPQLFARTAQIQVDETQKNKPATIKVLLEEGAENILLEVKGGYKVFCPHTNIVISSSSSATRGKMHPQNTGIFWSDAFPGTTAMRIVPNQGQTSILVNGIQYKGCLEVYQVDGKLRVINEVGIENYLRSCLATQCFNLSEPEVLNALIIVARTHAYYQVHKFPEAPWHVTAAETGYQGYGNTLQYLPLEQAIEHTRHAILTYNAKPFAASWSENSAGKTASFAAIFKDNAPAPKGVSIDGMESERMKSCWSFQVSKQELANLVKTAKVSNISVFSEKDSGKVYAVKISDQQNTKTLDFFSLQKALGESKLKSNDFTMEVQDQWIKFKGFGIGHGVGLCLHTARLMAKQGLDAKKILNQFFTGTELTKTRSVPVSKEI
ncbi:MAG: SpoIID/LytB domain-containing protein [Rhabdochlamydiaceae bacterium]|nr:SpoIID/LytB domain-containing protein [Rhabdochlamydiaceae bacterium]